MSVEFWSDDKQMHFALVFDEDSIKLFVNGYFKGERPYE